MTGRAVVALVSVGDMGAAVGAMLRAGGHRVVTPVAGRGPRTLERARQAGVEPVPDTAGAVAAADLILSVVPPRHAVDVAREVAAAAGGARPGTLLVDANSVAPATVRAVAEELAGTPLEVVDASIYGSSARLASNGALLLSGPGAERAAALVGDALPVRVVGPELGQASARKMLLAALTKGLCALILEAGAIADAAGQLGPSLDDYREFYPGIMELVDRMLPTYEHHAGRRADELGEIVELAAELGVDARMLGEAQAVTRQLLGEGDAAARFGRVATNRGSGG